MKELTKWQREPLFVLVDIQNEEEEQVLFLHHPPTISKITSEIHYVNDEKSQGPVLELLTATVHVWHKSGFVSIKESDSNFFSFVLLQDAIDYCELMRKSRLAREWTRFWRKSLERAPETFWGIVAGVLSGVTASLILYYFLP